jgi:hypothetical protein
MGNLCQMDLQFSAENHCPRLVLPLSNHRFFSVLRATDQGELLEGLSVSIWLPLLKPTRLSIAAAISIGRDLHVQYPPIPWYPDCCIRACLRE